MLVSSWEDSPRRFQEVDMSETGKWLGAWGDTGIQEGQYIEALEEHR